MTRSERIRNWFEAVIVWVGVPLMLTVAIILLVYTVRVAEGVDQQQDLSEDLRQDQADRLEEITGRTDLLEEDIGQIIAFIEQLEEQQTTQNGIICILGSMQTRPGAEQPPPDLVSEACEQFVEEAPD